MNESDQAALADADAEYDELNLSPDVGQQVEDLWLDGHKVAACRILRDNSNLTLAKARKLLSRVYRGSK